MSSGWINEISHASRTQKDLLANLFSDSEPSRMSNSRLDSPSECFQSTPIMHANGQGRVAYTGPDKPISVGSNLVGHSPAVDEGYYSSLSSLGNRELQEDEKSLLIPGLSDTQHMRRHGVRSHGSLGTNSSQSAFSPVPSGDSNRCPQSAAQANSFWSALANLRQQLCQTAPIQPTVLQPMMMGHPVSNASNMVPIPPLSYMPNSLLWPVENANRHPFFWPSYAVNLALNSDTKSVLCERMVAKVRQEMLELVETSMKQLECALLQGSVLGSQHNLSPTVPATPTSYSTSSSPTPPIQTKRTTADPEPTKPKPPPLTAAIDLYSISAGTGSERCAAPKYPSRLLSRTRQLQAQLQSTYLHQPQQQQQQPLHSQTTVRRRRLRIRSTGRRLRIKQSVIDMSGGHTNSPFADVERSIPHDGSLDLRVHREGKNIPIEEQSISRRPVTQTSYQLVDKSEIIDTTKTLTLNGRHLKRAKLMFLYSRYPSSSALKAFFPDVIFTRSTTAQMVKWFSNFR
ncbi:Prospero homeobox protein 1 [Fasciola gigantica]|uniref:Prospero homeobox protein 1 n=1 Tax=Fasciola gigantica TaxID=46835 RepID=A0A504YG17_FASGI|nr:Prospero homeobox protein 1 [Fasciola gigantica]